MTCILRFSVVFFQKTREAAVSFSIACVPHFPVVFNQKIKNCVHSFLGNKGGCCFMHYHLYPPFSGVHWSFQGKLEGDFIFFIVCLFAFGDSYPIIYCLKWKNCNQE